MALPDFTMRQLLEAGVHFGHQSHRWNPKMAPFIFGTRNNIHIVDLAQTVPMLHQALQAVSDTVAKGGRILFVGTKRQAQDGVADAAKRCAQYFVNSRWLGGTLTNWKTISASIKRLRHLDDVLSGGEANSYTKKERLTLQRERDKLDRSLGGIKDMQRIVAMNAGSALAFQVKRDGAIVSLTATPALLERKDPFGNSHRVGVLGVEHKSQAGEASTAPVGVGEALKIGVEQVWFIITSTFKFLGSLFVGQGNPNEVSGVLGIAKMSGQAASAGFQFVINLCAVLSVSIGLLNLFPIPLLDGGHLMFYAAEVVRGRPLSERTQEMGFRIGLGLVLMLMVFATYNDILRMAAS